jgi:hypothetical protein
MGKSEQYRRFAESCVTMANTTQDQQTRALFMQMAQVWFRLAEEHKEGTATDDAVHHDGR